MLQMKRFASHCVVAVGWALLAGCAATETSSVTPQQPATAVAETPPAPEYQATVPPEQRVKPPESEAAPAWSFPKINHFELANGLRVNVVERSALPLVELRLVVLSGQASDGAKPGTAVVAGELLKAGGTGKLTSREMLDKIESLGSSLSVQTEPDATHLSLAVTSDHFEEAVALMGDIALKPAFSSEEFRKLKRREMDRVASAAKTDAGWAASMVLYRELFHLETGKHPYSAHDATTKQLEQIGLWDCQAWHRTHFTPKNAFFVVSGQVTPDQAKAAAEKVFGAWRGRAPAKPSFSAPVPSSKPRIYLVNRPGSPQAEVRVATLGPERSSKDWAAVSVLNQVVGGGVAGRLFLDVREKRSLAYSTHSSVATRANGPSPIVLSAGTQTAKAGLTLQALFEHLALISGEPASPGETQIATRYLADVFLLRIETAAAVAALTSSLTLHGLADDYYDKYRDEVRAMTASAAKDAGSRYFAPAGAVVVVAGDAERLAVPLSHFGDVHVIDPEEDFVEKKVVPHAPDAKIELERLKGT